jgi:hypothetical protein
MGKGFHDVIYVVALDAVEVEVGGIEFAAQEEATFFIQRKEHRRNHSLEQRVEDPMQYT